MQAEAERELKETHERLSNGNEAKTAKAQEAIRVHELEVEKLKAEAEEQARYDSGRQRWPRSNVIKRSYCAR